MYLLDTDHVSLVVWPDSPEAGRLRERLEQTKIKGEIVATTIITFEEQTRGWLSHVSKARTLVSKLMPTAS
jgi:tRNA(fMet)-specific endonuclease VapC